MDDKLKNVLYAVVAAVAATLATNHYDQPAAGGPGSVAPTAGLCSPLGVLGPAKLTHTATPDGGAVVMVFNKQGDVAVVQVSPAGGLSARVMSGDAPPVKPRGSTGESP